MAETLIVSSTEDSDRRAFGRLDRVHKLFMQVIDDGSGGESRLLRCTCENVSAAGIAITLVESVPAGARVELWINVDDRDQRFLLGGVVRWCRPAVHRCLHEIGLELTDGPIDELRSWEALWSQRE